MGRGKFNVSNYDRWITEKQFHSIFFRLFNCRFSTVCPQRLPDISNETAALERMPKGRLEYLKRLLPYLKNQSEDCLYLNIYAPIQGRLNWRMSREICLKDLSIPWGIQNVGKCLEAFEAWNSRANWKLRLWSHHPLPIINFLPSAGSLQFLTLPILGWEAKGVPNCSLKRANCSVHWRARVTNGGGKRRETAGKGGKL